MGKQVRREWLKRKASHERSTTIILGLLVNSWGQAAKAPKAVSAAGSAQGLVSQAERLINLLDAGQRGRPLPTN